MPKIFRLDSRHAGRFPVAHSPTEASSSYLPVSRTRPKQTNLHPGSRIAAGRRRGRSRFPEVWGQHTKACWPHHVTAAAGCGKTARPPQPPARRLPPHQPLTRTTPQGVLPSADEHRPGVGRPGARGTTHCPTSSGSLPREARARAAGNDPPPGVTKDSPMTDRRRRPGKDPVPLRPEVGSGPAGCPTGDLDGTLVEDVRRATRRAAGRWAL